MARPIETVRRLRDGEVIELEGLKFRMSGDGEVNEGDLYIAGRNTGPHLMTCKRVDKKIGCIYSTVVHDYPFDIHECVKVEEAE